MRKHVLALLLMAPFLVASVSGFGQGKTTVDPNSVKKTAPKETPRSDARLDRRVTYNAEFATVQDILADLHEITGIRLTAGSGISDWHVRSRRMNVFVKNVRMSDLMDSIARTMKFTWVASEDVEPPVYRLVVDRKAAAAADAQVAAAEKRREELWEKRRKQWLDVIMKDGGKSPTEVAAMRTSDPVFYRYAQTGGLRAVRALFVAVPEAKKRFAEGRSFRVSLDGLNKETCDLLIAGGDQFAQFMQRGRMQEAVGFGDTFKPDDKIDVAYSRLDEGTFTPNLCWGIYSQGSIGQFYLARGEETWQIVEPKEKDADWTKALCRRESSIIDDGGNFDTTRAALLSHSQIKDESNRKEEELLYPSEPLIEHPELPELNIAIKLKVKPQKRDISPAMVNCLYVAALQKALADASGMSVVSDSWVSIQGSQLPENQSTLRELLDAFGKEFNYNWDCRAGVLEFRHRKWWRNRQNQLPEGMILVWSENTRQNGILDLDDLAQISNLTYGQAEESLKIDEVLGAAGIYQGILDILDDNLPWLRLYSSLTPEQRLALTSAEPGGLTEGQLSPVQIKRAEQLFDRIGAHSDCKMRLDPSPTYGQGVYEFKQIATDTGALYRKSVLILPRYYAPPGTRVAEE